MGPGRASRTEHEPEHGNGTPAAGRARVSRLSTRAAVALSACDEAFSITPAAALSGRYGIRAGTPAAAVRAA